MSLKLPVPDPTENDFTLEKSGYETWYEHDSECGPSPDKMEDWKQEVLALIRLANYHQKRESANFSAFTNSCMNHGVQLEIKDQEIEVLKSELLTLRESTAPKMAEVDALTGDFTVEECDQPCLTTWMQRNKALGEKLRTAILACEKEKQRADHLRIERDTARLEAKLAADGLREILAAVRAGVPMELCGKTYVEQGAAK